MPNTPTTNLGLIVPTVGGDNNTWGTELNSNLVVIDTLAVCAVIKTSVNISLAVRSAVEQVVLVTTASGTILVGLPPPVSCAGKIFNVKKVDSGVGTISLVPASGTIDGFATWSISGQYSNLRVMSDGVNYDIL